MRICDRLSTEVALPPDADADGEWRSALVERYASVRAFVPMLCGTITFGATADAAGVLSALRDLPRLLDARVTKALPAGCLDARQVAVDIIPAGWWRRLVFKPDRPKGTVDRAGYVFCVLEQFHRHLIRRNIYATPSARGPARATAHRPGVASREGTGAERVGAVGGSRRAVARAFCGVGRRVAGDGGEPDRRDRRARRL